MGRRSRTPLSPPLLSLTLLLLLQHVDRAPAAPKLGGHLLQRGGALGQALELLRQRVAQGRQLAGGQAADVDAALGLLGGHGMACVRPGVFVCVLRCVGRRDARREKNTLFYTLFSLASAERVFARFRRTHLSMPLPTLPSRTPTLRPPPQASPGLVHAPARPGTGSRAVAPPTATPARADVSTRRAALAASLLTLLHPAAATAAAAQPPPSLRYSQFLDELEAGTTIQSVAPAPGDATTLEATRTDGTRFRVTLPPPPPPPLGGDPDLLDRLLAKGVEVQRSGDGGGGTPSPPPPPSLFASATGAALAVTTLTLVWRWLAGPGASASSPSDGTASPPGFDPFRTGALAGMRHKITPVATTTTFADVAGLETAKLELSEVVAFVRDPDRFARLGARVPRGVLLTGPSGTGKTLLARAVAGEAGVPFFCAAGSEFVEVFVGLGAARVRDLFAAARAAAPCVLLVDEIDAVGRTRGTGWGGGNDEREQTLNQLLTEMDGFDGAGGAASQVVVLAATNRPDILDPALTRAGRFDRRVQLDLPDVAARTAILRLYARGKPLAPSVDLPRLAQRTPGFSGAQLANVLNEASIAAARRASDVIDDADVDAALERVLAGPERLSALVSPQRRRAVAVHEGGHAVVATLVPDGDAVAKVSIVPR